MFELVRKEEEIKGLLVHARGFPITTFRKEEHKIKAREVDHLILEALLVDLRFMSEILGYKVNIYKGLIKNEYRINTKKRFDDLLREIKALLLRDLVRLFRDVTYEIKLQEKI